MDTIEFTCFEMKQPVGNFYIGIMNYDELVAISYADVRRIEQRDVERIVGIQRPLSDTRVAELAQYVNTLDASFPSGVILAVDSKDVDFDEKTKRMLIRKDENVAKIIDGQHRIAGLKQFRGERFDVNVTLFVDMDLEDQAMLFATINLKQTKVSKSLAYDLYEYETTRSPQKTCHMIARLLNTKKDSPFKDKIKVLGVATPDKEETLTQATFVEHLLDYISGKGLPSLKDRDDIKRGVKLKRAVAGEFKKRPFRNLFIDEKDTEIARIVWNYFKAVERKWPSAWGKRSSGNVLNRTTGFNALMKFMRPVCLDLGYPDKVYSVDEYFSYFNRVKLSDESFTPDNFNPGTSGQVRLFKTLMEQTGLEKDDGLD